MRVARGSGNVGDIAQQVLTCAVTLRRYAEENGSGPSPIGIGKVLAAERFRDEATGELNSLAVEEVISGSLQVAASRISGDREREYQGEAQILKAVRGGTWGARS